MLFRSERSQSLFSRILANAPRRWRFNQSPLFLEFLQGALDLECRPWGTPTYNLFGWQRPCYLLDEGYVATFRELMEETDWQAYGRSSGNPKCADCMVHCGFEATAVNDSFQRPLNALKVMMRGVRTEGPMAPEISLAKQRPAEFVFSRHVEKKLASIRAEESKSERATAAE